MVNICTNVKEGYALFDSLGFGYIGDSYIEGHENDVAHSWAWRCALDQGMRPADIVRAELQSNQS